MKKFFTKEITYIERVEVGWNKYEDVRKTKTELRIGRVVACGIIAFLLVLTLILSITRIPTGHTGVVSSFGRVEAQTLDEGIHFKAPWKRVIKMDNRIQKASLELSCFSSDIQETSILYTVNYQINSQTTHKFIKQ